MYEKQELIVTISLSIVGVIAVITLLYLGIVGSVGFTVSWHHYFTMIQRIYFGLGAIFIILVAGFVIYVLNYRN